MKPLSVQPSPLQQSPRLTPGEGGQSSTNSPRTNAPSIDIYDDPNNSHNNGDTDLFEKEIDITKGDIYDHNIYTKELSTLLKNESTTPIDRVLVMTSMALIVIISSLLKGGGKRFPSLVGIQCGSVEYWSVTASVIILIFLISIWARSVLVAKWRLKQRLRYVYQEGDVEWNPSNTIKYPSICFFAGFCAGMFGIGGGVVKGPLMLQMGRVFSLIFTLNSALFSAYIMAYFVVVCYRNTPTSRVGYSSSYDNVHFSISNCYVYSFWSTTVGLCMVFIHCGVIVYCYRSVFSP